MPECAPHFSWTPGNQQVTRIGDLVIPGVGRFASPSSSRPRTPRFQCGNTGSNPVGDATDSGMYLSYRRPTMLAPCQMKSTKSQPNCQQKSRAIPGRCRKRIPRDPVPKLHAMD